MNFETFNLHPSIMAGVRALGYSVPTPIQLQVIPPIMQGRDVIGLAQTGTGKTAAFVLPILERLRSGPRGRVRALIISPTRELAEQTCEVINNLGSKTGLQSISVYGGVSMEQQTRDCAAALRLSWPARAVCLTTSGKGLSVWRTWKSSSSTRPTVCSIWAFCPMYAAY